MGKRQLAFLYGEIISLPFWERLKFLLTGRAKILTMTAVTGDEGAVSVDWQDVQLVALWSNEDAAASVPDIREGAN